MHSAIPFPRFGAEGLDDAARGQLEQRIRQFKNLCEVLGLRYRVHRGELPDGTPYTLVWNYGKCKAVVEPREREEDHTGKAHVDVPTFFSGEALSTAVRYGQDGEVMEGAQLSLTQQCRARLGGYETTDSGAPVLAPQRVRLRRFVIGYGHRFGEFVRPSGMKILQYAQLRPTWWSGRMAAVVQLAQGYGIHDFEKLPDAPYEKATLPVPEEVGAQIAQQLGLDAEGKGGAILPACKGWPVKSGETQFDYKASRTEGVAFGSDRAPWLVRISSQGVFAMPLPIVPATRTAAFRAWIELVGDAEIKWLLDTFGGMPSGEGFPESPEEFAAWRRAGVIIRMGSAGDFYALAPYSTATGWSFNSSGRQAVNTGWRFGDDGLKRGEFWTLHMNIGALADNGLAHEVVIPSGTSAVFIERAQRYISIVEQAAAPALQQGNALVRAALYAFRRAPFDDIMARAESSMTQAADELEYWRNYEALPIALASCAAAKIGEGILWAPGEPKRHPQIKFPEPAAEPQGCYSFDFGRLEGSAPPNPEPLCDTIMHAYFIGDDLKVVKYFRDTREVAARVDRNYDEGDVLTVGTWLETITYTPSGLLGNFYTSDFDERELAAEHSKTTKTTGSDKGYDNPPFFQQDYLFATGYSIWRNRYVQYDQQAWEVKSYGARVAVCVPYFAPHAALYAWKWDKTGNVKTTARSVGSIRDPNSYRAYTYHFVWAWSGSGAPANKENYTGELDPSPMIKKVGDPVWVIGYNYDPGAPGSDFADRGDWMGGLPQDYTWLVNPNSGEWKTFGGGSPPTIKQFTRTEHMPDETGGSLQVSYAPLPKKIMDVAPDIMYFAPSPDDFGAVFYRDATRNEAGKTEYGNVSESPGGIERFHWGWCEVADSRSAHHFIGVLTQ